VRDVSAAPSRGLGEFGNCYVLYAIGADYVAVALPTEQAGKPQETEQAPVIEAAVVAVGRSGLIHVRLGDSRRYDASGQ
jgi:hypothetical protein